MTCFITNIQSNLLASIISYYWQEAAALPAVLPVFATTINLSASAEAPIGASRDGDSERRTERSNSRFLHQRCHAAVDMMD